MLLSNDTDIQTNLKKDRNKEESEMYYALINLVLVLIGALIAYLQGRLTHSQMDNSTMPWTAHGGMWADLILVSIIACLIAPYTKDWQVKQFAICLGIALVATIGCHIAWAMTMPINGHLIDPAKTGIRKLTYGGWYHIFYMALTVSVILMYFLYTPGAPRLAICILLSIAIIPMVMQPGWYIGKIVNGVGRVDAFGWIASIGAWAIIWGLGYTRP